jgi:hypothetical protein
MSTGTTLVSLDYPFARKHLVLARTPRYLRFVITGNDWKTLDALDQLDDQPEAGEAVFAAILKGFGHVHFDGVRNGKRYGELHRTTTYQLVDQQPPPEVLRDTTAWQNWCVKQEQMAGKE